MRESWTDKRLDDFRAGVNRRFGEVDRRFDEVDRRFEQVDARFDRVDARFDRVDAKFDAMNERFDSMYQLILRLGIGFGTAMVALFAALLGIIATQL